jgi:hypothetical protein
MKYRLDILMTPNIEGIVKVWSWFMVDFNASMRMLDVFYDNAIRFSVEQTTSDCEL